MLLHLKRKYEKLCSDFGCCYGFAGHDLRTMIKIDTRINEYQFDLGSDKERQKHNVIRMSQTTAYLSLTFSLFCPPFLGGKYFFFLETKRIKQMKGI